MIRILTENITLKISAVLIATLLWFFVTSRGQSEISLDAAVEFRGIPDSLAVVSSSVRTVGITIRGQERLIKNVRPSDVRVLVDLEKAKPGELLVQVAPSDVKLPQSVSVTGISPNQVKVRLDETITRSLRVEPVFANGGDDGLLAVSVEPKTVTVKGLKSEVRRLTVVRTEPIEIGRLDGQRTFDAALDTAGLNAMVDPADVKVTVSSKGKRK